MPCLTSHFRYCTPSANNEIASRRILRDPDALESLLLGEGGIAEFILPLLHLSVLSSVTWVRSPWSRQFECGAYSFGFGDAAGAESVGVTLKHPYYLDDSKVLPAAEMRNIKAVELSVLCLGSECACATVADRAEAADPWVLDICLDYFSTANPFLEELAQRLAADGQEHLLATLLLGFEGMAFRTRVDKSAGELVSLRTLTLGKLAEASLTMDSGLPVTETSVRGFDDLFDETVCPRTFLCALASLSESARAFTVSAAQALLLPHHTNTRDGIEASLSRLVQFLRHTRVRPPVAVLVARSALDGFTPDAAFIEERVLAAIRLELLPHWGTALSLQVHDMTEVAWSACACFSALLDSRSGRRKRKLEACGVL
jgi:hypothetical protein